MKLKTSSQLIAFLTFSFISADAQSIWSNPASGTWNTSSNWQPASVPSAGADLVFNNRLASGYTATNDLGAFTAGSITFDARVGIFTGFTGTLVGATLANTGVSTLTLSGTGATLSQAGGGTVGITGDLILGSSVSVAGAGNGMLFLDGVISGGGQLTFDRSNATTQTIVRGTNTYTGGTTLNSGQLALGNASALGTGTLTINGGSLRMSSFTSPSGTTLSNSILANSTVKFVGNNSGIFSGVISGTGGFTNQAATGITSRLTNVNSYQGATTAAASPSGTSSITVQFEGNGSALNSSSYKAEGFTSINLDNTVTNITNRLNDTAPVTLERATFSFVGNDSAASSETIGALSISGFSTVGIAPAAFQSATLTAASLTRNDRAVLFARGLALGINAPGTANTASLLFTSSPAASLIGGGGLEGSTTQSILAYAVGRGANTGNADTFVTYDASKGVRALLTTEFASTVTDGSITTDNLRLTTAATLTNPTTVNSLILAGGSLSGSGSLSITSGAVLIASGTPTIASPLAFGSAEAIITTQGNTVFSASMTGSNGLTKAGTSTLTLSTAPSITGPLTINAGAVSVASDSLLGSLGNTTINGGRLNFSGTGTEATNRNFITGNAGGTLDIAGTLTLNNAVTGTGIFIKQGSGNLIFTTANSYTGNTVINGGVLTISNGNQLGSGEQIVMPSSATLRTVGMTSVVTDKSILLTGGSGSATFDTVAPLTLTQGIQHNGSPTNAFSITKTGASSLTLEGASNMNGVVNVNAGLLIVNGTLGSPNTSAPPLVIASAAGLGGTGVITRDVSFFSNSLVDPGNSPGTLTVNGDVTFAGNAGFRFELSSTTYDRLDVNGNTLLNGGVMTLFLTNVDGTLPTAFGGYAFLTTDGMTGTEPTFALDFTSAPTWSGLGLGVNRVGNDFVLSVIPEPSSALLTLLALTSILRRRR